MSKKFFSNYLIVTKICTVIPQCVFAISLTLMRMTLQISATPIDNCLQSPLTIHCASINTVIWFKEWNFYLPSVTQFTYCIRCLDC